MQRPKDKNSQIIFLYLKQMIRSCGTASAAKFKSAFADWRYSAALQPITHDSVELMNATTNQRRSDESSLKHAVLFTGELSHQKQQSADERMNVSK